MTIYEKMHAIVAYYSNTVLPYINEQVAKVSTMTEQDKDDTTTDINNLMYPVENAYKDLLHLCNNNREINVVDAFKDEMLSLLIDDAYEITERYFTE
mgnify:CR=1 FL=1|jgi:hypothetical protein